MHKGDYLPDSILSGQTILSANGPCVYAWVRDEKFLYIGQSIQLFHRLANHNMVNTPANPMLPTDKLLIWHFKDKKQATLREMEMIMQYLPTLNFPLTRDKLDKAECLYCGKEFVMVRKWQKFCSKRCQTANGHPYVDDMRPLE